MATGTLSNISLNAVTTAGMYRLQGGITDLPPWADGRWQWSQLFVMHGGGDTVTQIIGVFTTGGVNGYLAYRNNGDPGWDDWRQLATATPPQVYDLPLTAGWEMQNVSFYIKSQEHIVTVCATLIATTDHTSGLVIATLPEGFRPPDVVECPAVLKNPSGIGSIVVYTNGEVRLWCDGVATGQIFTATTVFVAA